MSSVPKHTNKFCFFSLQYSEEQKDTIQFSEPEFHQNTSPFYKSLLAIFAAWYLYLQIRGDNPISLLSGYTMVKTNYKPF